MDRFIIRERKNNPIFSNIAGAVCLWGPHGTGKTTWIKDNFDYLEINYDSPSDFMERVLKSKYVLIDNFETLDKDFEKWFTRPRTIYISKHPIPQIFCHEFHNKTNLRNLFGATDIHMDPKDYIIEKMSHSGRYTSYIESIDKCSTEHGNGFGMVFENYIKCCDLDECCRITESLVTANEIDNAIYKGQWDHTTLMFFNAFTYAVPFNIIKGRVDQVTSATLWSKYLNGCMKKKKLRDLGLDINSLLVLRDYAVNNENPLNLSSSELDVLKYVDFSNKLKAKTIQKLKKCQTKKKKV